MNPLLDVPPAFARVVVAAYGLVLGSFLNVVIHRVPRGLSVVRPRSTCPSCGHLIRWFENVPVISWLVLRARCSSCGSPIAWRYPAVEALTAALMLVALETQGPGVGLVVSSLFILLVLALIFIDYEHMLLPDAITLPGTFAGLALSFVSPLTNPASALLGVLLGLFVIEGLNLAYKLVRGHDGMGAGDTKMMMMMGAFLGWDYVIVSLALAVVIGLVVAVPALIVARARARKTVPVETVAPPDAAGATEADVAATPGPEAADRRSALADVVPRGADEWLGLLTILALVASFVLPDQDPERSLLGALAGIAVLVAVRRIVPRLWWAAVPLPLVGAVAGLPPLVVPGWIAVAVGVAGALAARRAPLEVAPVDVPGDEDDVLPAGADAPTLLQAAVPFGVFLGIASLLTLLAGDAIVDWWLALPMFSGGDW